MDEANKGRFPRPRDRRRFNERQRTAMNNNERQQVLAASFHPAGESNDLVGQSVSDRGNLGDEAPGIVK
jgi:hypothetical protein